MEKTYFLCYDMLLFTWSSVMVFLTYHYGCISVTLLLSPAPRQLFRVAKIWKKATFITFFSWIAYNFITSMTLINVTMLIPNINLWWNLITVFWHIPCELYRGKHLYHSRCQKGTSWNENILDESCHFGQISQNVSYFIHVSF